MNTPHKIHRPVDEHNLYIWLAFIPSVFQAMSSCGIAGKLQTLQRWITCGALASTEVEKVPFHLALEMITEATMLTAPPDSANYFPIEVARHFSFGDLSDLDILIQTSGSLRSAYQSMEFVSFYSYPSIAHKWRRTTEYTELTLASRFSHLDVSATWAYTECTIMTMLHYMKKIGVDNAAQICVHFRHPPHARTEMLANFLSCKISHNAKFDGVLLDNRALETPLQTANRSAHKAARIRMVRHHLPRIFFPKISTLGHAHPSLSESHSNILDRVIFELDRSPGLLNGGIADLATAINSPPRTLQREFQRAGTSWRELQRAIKVEVAKHLLQGGHPNEKLRAQMLGHETLSGIIGADLQ